MDNIDRLSSTCLFDKCFYFFFLFFFLSLFFFYMENMKENLELFRYQDNRQYPIQSHSHKIRVEISRGSRRSITCE